MLSNLKKWNFWLVTVILLIFTLFFVSLILLAARVNPLSFLNTIFIKPVSNIIAFSNLVQTFSVLLLVGLATTITFKYRIYNLGVSGQMMFSAMVVYVLARAISAQGVSSQWITPFLLLMAIIIGSLSGLVTAVLKTVFKVHEIISTILFNFIAWEGYKGLMVGYKDLSIPTAITNLRFSAISGPFSFSNLFSGALIIALVVLVVAILIFNNRTFGFKLNAIAKNPVAAKQARLNPQYQMLIIFPISAAIAGVAGYIYFLGVNNHLPTLTGPLQEGFYGIVVGTLALFEPFFVLFATILVSFLVSPIQFNSFIYLKNPEFAVIILGIVTYLMGIYPFIWDTINKSSVIKNSWEKLKLKVTKRKASKVKPMVEVVHLGVKDANYFKNKWHKIKTKILKKNKEQ